MKQASTSRQSRTASPAKSSPNRRDVILKKREEQWMITPTRGIPQYSADKDPHCPKAVVRTYNRVKRENALQRAAKGKGASEWIEKTMKKKFEDIPIRETPSLREKASMVALETESVGEVEILQKIIVRENLLNELRTLLKYQTDIDSVASEIAEFVRAIRHQSLTIVEDIHGWKCAQSLPRQFLYRGENYLLKMMDDASFLDQFEELYELFGFYFTGNPLMYSGRSFGDNSMTSDSKPFSNKLAPLDLYRDERFVDGINERRLRFAEEIIEKEVRAYEAQSELIVGERGMNESSVLNDRSNPVSRRNSVKLSSRKNSAREMSSTLPQNSLEVHQSSVLSRSLNDMPYSGAPYQAPTPQITVPNRRLEKLHQLKEELEEMRAMRAHLEEQVMFNVNEHKKLAEKVKRLELKRQDAISLRRDAYAQHTAVEISIVQVNMQDVNMTIKNLQRQSYFIEQEMKRKKVLISAVKKEIAEEKKTKHLKNALMNKVKKNGLISVLLDVNKSDDMGSHDDDVSLPADDVSYSVEPHGAEDNNSLSLVETSAHELPANEEEDDDVLIPEVKTQSNRVLNMLDSMPELDNSSVNSHRTEKSARPAVMFRGDTDNIEVAIHRPQGYSDTGKFSPPKSLVAYREAVKESIAEVEHLAYFIADSALNSVVGYMKSVSASKKKQKAVSSSPLAASIPSSDQLTSHDASVAPEQPLEPSHVMDDAPPISTGDSALDDILNDKSSSNPRKILTEPSSSRADAIIQEILQGVSRTPSEEPAATTHVSPLDDDASASNAVAEEVGFESIEGSIELQDSIVSEDDGMYDSSVVLEDEEAENSDVMREISTQTDILDQIDMLSMTGGSVDANSTEKKTKKRKSKKNKKSETAIAVGTKVETKGKGKNNWNRGSILKIRPNNTLDIQLEDGTKVFSVTPDLVKTLPAPKPVRKRRPIKAGSSVDVYQNKKWLRGTVSKIRANQSYLVDVIDGEQGIVVTKDRIRLAKKAKTPRKKTSKSAALSMAYTLHSKVEVQLAKSTTWFFGEIVGIAPKGSTYTVRLETGEKVAGISADRLRAADIEASSMDELSNNEIEAPDVEHEDMQSSFDSLSRAEKHLALSLMRHEIHNIADAYAKDITKSAMNMVSMTQRYGSDYSTEPESYSEMSSRASSPGRVFRGVVRPAGGGYALVKAKKSGSRSFDIEVLNVDSEVQVTHSNVGTARTPRVIDEVIQEAATSMGGLERVLQGEKQGLIYQMGVPIHGEYRLLQLRRFKTALHLTSYRLDGARMKTVHLSSEDVADIHDHNSTSAYLQRLLESYELGVIAQHELVVHARKRSVALCRNRKGLYITVHDRFGQLIWTIPLDEEETDEIYNSYNLPQSLRCIVDRSNSGTLHRMGVMLWEKCYLLKLQRNEENLFLMCMRMSDGKVECMPLDEEYQESLETSANYTTGIREVFSQSQTGLVYRCTVVMFGKSFTVSVMKSDCKTEVIVLDDANAMKKYEFKLSSAEVTMLESSRTIAEELTVKCLEKFRGTIVRMPAVVLGSLYFARVYKATTGVWLAAYDVVHDTKRIIRLSPEQEGEILRVRASRRMIQRVMLNSEREGIIAKTAVRIGGIYHLAELVHDEDGFHVSTLRIWDSKVRRYAVDEELLFSYDVTSTLLDWCARNCCTSVVRCGVVVHNRNYLVTLICNPTGMTLRATNALTSKHYFVDIDKDEQMRLLESTNITGDIRDLLANRVVTAPLPQLPLNRLPSADYTIIAKLPLVLYGVSYLIQAGKDCEGFYISSLRLRDDFLRTYRPTSEDAILFSADIPTALKQWCYEHMAGSFLRLGVLVDDGYYLIHVSKQRESVRFNAVNAVSSQHFSHVLSPADADVLQSSSDIVSDVSTMLLRLLRQSEEKRSSGVCICSKAYLVSRCGSMDEQYISLLRLSDNQVKTMHAHVKESIDDKALLRGHLFGSLVRCGVMLNDKHYLVGLSNSAAAMELTAFDVERGLSHKFSLSREDADTCWNCKEDIVGVVSTLLKRYLKCSSEFRCGIFVKEKSCLARLGQETVELYNVAADIQTIVPINHDVLQLRESPRRIVELHAASVLI